MHKIMRMDTDIIVHSAKENGQSNTNQRCRNACLKLFCRNERKEKAQNRFVATGPSEYYSGGLFIFGIVRRAGLSLSHVFRR